MFSQIGQVVTGQNSNSILGASGTDHGNRDTSREGETFQSVLASEPNSPEPGQIDDAVLQPEIDEPPSDNQNSVPEDEIPELTMEVTEPPQEVVQQTESDAPATASEDVDEFLFEATEVSQGGSGDDFLFADVGESSGRADASKSESNTLSAVKSEIITVCLPGFRHCKT